MKQLFLPSSFSLSSHSFLLPICCHPLCPCLGILVIFATLASRINCKMSHILNLVELKITRGNHMLPLKKAGRVVSKQPSPFLRSLFSCLANVFGGCGLCVLAAPLDRAVLFASQLCINSQLASPAAPIQDWERATWFECELRGNS